MLLWAMPGIALRLSTSPSSLATCGLLLLLLMTTAAACGDDRKCTLIGCNTGVEVTFDPPLTTPGTYAVEVEIDGVITHCHATLPLGPEGTDGCDAQAVVLYRSGSALPAAAHSLPGMHLPSTTATSVSVRIQRDGVEVVRTSLSPAYARSYPNGPDCDPMPCVSASATVPTP